MNNMDKIVLGFGSDLAVVIESNRRLSKRYGEDLTIEAQSNLGSVPFSVGRSASFGAKMFTL